MKMITRRLFLTLLAALTTTLSWSKYDKAPTSVNYSRINKQAVREYLQPIRPGYEHHDTYWNTYAFKFIYAPAFDFKKIPGAVKYRYTLVPDTEVKEKISKKAVAIKNPSFAPVSFVADHPNSSLSPIWNKIPAAHVVLTVEGLDKNGKVIGEAGKRKFLRDFGFCGPYNNAVRPYREAAIKAMLCLHHTKEVKTWLDSSVPTMDYSHYTYAAKIISAVIRNESLVARYVPQERKTAIQIAESAANFLISLSQPAGTPMAYFPPTYYKNLIASKRAENQGTAITMDANYAVHAFLDLYDVCGKKKYYEQATNILRTYKKLQRPDGSFPIKIYLHNGQPTNERNAMLHSICVTCQRMLTQYQTTEFEDMKQKAEKWMHDVAIRSFDMTGQFEDVSVNGVRPYENLTNCTAAPYAKYLLGKPHPTQEEIADAKDLLRLSEDQFTYWDHLYNEWGFRRYNTPCVIEQYRYKTPVDNSAANVSGGFLEYYKETGDPLAYAKAKALIDNFTIMQNAKNGFMPTTWDCSFSRTNEVSVWYNCFLSGILRMLEMDALQTTQKK